MSDLYPVLESAITSGNETRKIDLKREVDLSDKPHAAKFAKIISALANTPGGTAYIVIGVKDRKERESDDPREYIVGFDVEQADDFQRMLQQALTNYLEPIPTVDVHLVEHPIARRTLGVVRIARSFNRPHRLKKASGEVEPGVYLKRGAETHLAQQNEIDAMRQASENSRLIVNFTRPLTTTQLIQIRDLIGALPEVVDLPRAPIQFPNEELLSEYVVTVLDSAGLTSEEWNSLLLIVNLPGIAPAAAAVLAEIHGRSGRFPHVLRMTPSPDDNNVYIVKEIVKLQNIRDAARGRGTM